MMMMMSLCDADDALLLDLSRVRARRSGLVQRPAALMVLWRLVLTAVIK